MKVTNHNALLKALASLNATQTPSPVLAAKGDVNWQSEYNKLRTQMLRMRKQLEDVLHPPRSDEEFEHSMAAVVAFLDSMSDAEGAVVCSNIYNAAFFERERDTKFVKALCNLLVTRYQKSSALIERPFDLWLSKSK